MAKDIAYIIVENGFYFVAYKEPMKLPYVTVSSKGVANGLSEEFNDGWDFGPDSYNPSSTEKIPYTSTVGIQEAVNYANPGSDATISGEVLLMGEFGISETIVLPNGNKVILKSAGYERAAIYPLVSGMTLIQGTPGPQTNVFEFEGITFTTEEIAGSEVSGSYAFYYKPSTFTFEIVRFRDCYFRGSWSVNVTSVTGVDDVRFENCLFGGSLSTGPAMYTVNTITFTDCHWASYSDGIHVEGSNIGVSNTLTITGTRLRTASGIAPIQITNYGNVSINLFGNTFDATDVFLVIDSTSTVPFLTMVGNQSLNSITSSPISIQSGGKLGGWFERGNSFDLFLDATLSGTTAGTLVAKTVDSNPGYKKVLIYVNGYENDTTTSQTLTYTIPFSTVAAVTSNTSGLTVSTSTTALTITAPDATTVYNGIIIVEGY